MTPWPRAWGPCRPITGFEDRGPIKSGVWIADWITGLSCAVAIMAALNYRERTGEGQFIDYMQVENVIRWLDWTWLYTFKTGEDRKRSGNRDLAICPSDLFECHGRLGGARGLQQARVSGSVRGHGPDGPA